MSWWSTVARGVALGRRAVEQVLAGPFGHDDHGVAAVEHPPLAARRGTRSSPSRAKGTSGISVKLTSWLASVAAAAMKPASRPITFTRPMPLTAPAGFDVGAAEHLVGLLHGGHQPERLLAIGDVVVDRLGDADDGDRQSAAGDLFVDAMGAALGAVAADAEEHVDPLALEEIDDHGRRPARRATSRASCRPPRGCCRRTPSSAGCGGSATAGLSPW